MSYPMLAPEARPCVWMCAGLLSYKLCERGFDCERCPLDAALRGTLSGGSERITPHLDRRADAELFPRDRLYADGHLWIKAASHDDVRVWRVGLDAFAAALVGCAVGVGGPPPGSAVARGSRVFDLDLGLGEPLTLNAPLSGTVHRVNDALHRHPHRAVTEPYGDGWLVELQGLDAGSVLGLRTATEALEVVQEEIFTFRRALALRLLLEPAGSGWGRAGSADPLSDLRDVLGGPRYLELVGQFVY